MNFKCKDGIICKIHGDASPIDADSIFNNNRLEASKKQNRNKTDDLTGRSHNFTTADPECDTSFFVNERKSKKSKFFLCCW